MLFVQTPYSNFLLAMTKEGGILLGWAGKSVWWYYLGIHSVSQLYKYGGAVKRSNFELVKPPIFVIKGVEDGSRLVDT